VRPWNLFPDRLREAATGLVAEPGKALDIALDCGFIEVPRRPRSPSRQAISLSLLRNFTRTAGVYC
jgi:hypothetical protein